MKKTIKIKKIFIQKKRERKRIRRLRKNKQFYGVDSIFLKEHYFRKKYDKKIAEKFKYPLYDFFVEHNFIDGSEKISEVILIPPNFSFCKSYNIVVETLKNFTASIFKNVGKEITIDFSQCKDVDYAALFVLQILKLEFQAELNRLDRRMSVLSGEASFKIINSQEEEVNKLLLVAGLIPEADLAVKGLLPIDSTGYLKGSKSQKHYSENKKGAIATRIVQYLNKCLSHHGYNLLPEGINHFGGLISEILNNAEDHSPNNTYYASASFLRELEFQPDENVVGEINLTFMNFGYSIFEGFEGTKTKNTIVYESLEKMYLNVKNSKLFFPFTKENIFTLYSLQEGISRLKYEDESRGSGTVRFITSFFDLGDYEDDVKDFHPSLSLISGATQLICDNIFKPSLIDGLFVLSLNQNNDLLSAPETSNLINLKYSFPGTLFSVRLYINKEHLKNKIDGNGKNSN